MTEIRESGEQFVRAWRENAATLQAAHAYDPAHEHESCGVGFVASIDGSPRRDVVTSAIAALQAVWHRGAVDAAAKEPRRAPRRGRTLHQHNCTRRAHTNTHAHACQM